MVRLGPMGGKFIWVKTIWDHANAPRHPIIANLAIHNKLLTMDNLELRGVQTEQKCVFCLSEKETASNLFFGCPVTRRIWSSVLYWTGIKRSSSNNLKVELKWFSRFNRGKSDICKMRRSALTGTLYEIWIERNCRIFKKNVRGKKQICDRIKFKTCARVFSQCNPNVIIPFLC